MNTENNLKAKSNIYIGRRSRLTCAFFFAMLGLSILNICFNVIPSNMSDNNLNMTFTLISQVFCMGLLPFSIATVLTKKKDENLLSSAKNLMIDFGYTKNLKPKQWLLLIPLAITFYLLTKLMSMITVLILTFTGFQFPISAPTVYKGAGDLIKWILLTALLPAIFEEFSHRGLALNAMKDRGSEATQVFLSALLFSLMHTNIMQSLYAFIGGCIFGYIAVRTKSIYAGMVLHFANNAFATIEDYSSQHPEGMFGFIDRLNDFWYRSNVSILIYVAVLLLNALLFVFLLKVFIDQCEPRTAVHGFSFFSRKKQKLTMGLDGKYHVEEEKTDNGLDIDLYRPDGKPALLDNVMLYTTIAMCGLCTVFTFVWGVLR